jgi:hypothetical protein
MSAGGFPQPLHVAHGWNTKDTFILPVEVGCINERKAIKVLIEV